jgi:Tfp pilus assembly protein PilF
MPSANSTGDWLPPLLGAMLLLFGRIAARRRTGIWTRAVREETASRSLELFAVCVFAALPLVAANSSRERLLDFEGVVSLPPHTVSVRRRLGIQLQGVDSPFSGEGWADLSGRFHFHNLKPGCYSVSIHVPSAGWIVQTVDITKSFSDAKGTVRREFEFDEQTLRSLTSGQAESLVSVRQLGISRGARAEYGKAIARLERSDANGAIRHLERAVQLAPGFSEALNHLGTIYFERRDYSKAESYFRQALQQDPQSFEPLVNLGGALLAQGRDREALEVNRHAQNARPKDPLANAQLGLSYLSLGEYDRAIASFRATEEIDPAHFTYPQISLAQIYLRLADGAAALRQLEDFLKVHPDAPQAEAVRAAIDRIRKEQESHSATETSQGRRPQ